MSSNDPSSSSEIPQSLNRAATLPLNTTSSVEIIGQVPEPLSPSDKSPSADSSLSTALKQQRAAQATEAKQHQIEAETVSPESATTRKGINLPLPASSSLIEPEQQFSRPLRTQTAPSAGFNTSSSNTTGGDISPQAITSSKTFPVADAAAPATEPNPTMSGQQPLIAELPGTPVSHHDSDVQTQRMDTEIALEQSARLKATKSEDAAVIYDIPVTPTAQAFEVANKNTIGKGYFEPIFPEGQQKKVEAAKVEAA